MKPLTVTHYLLNNQGKNQCQMLHQWNIYCRIFRKEEISSFFGETNTLNVEWNLFDSFSCSRWHIEMNINCCCYIWLAFSECLNSILNNFGCRLTYPQIVDGGRVNTWAVNCLMYALSCQYKFSIHPNRSHRDIMQSFVSGYPQHEWLD